MADRTGTKQRASRPPSVTWLTVGVLSFTVVFVTRLLLAIRQWAFLSQLPLTVPPAYLALSGFVWSMVGALTAWGLWFGKLWAKRGMQIAASAFALYYWTDHLFLVSDPLKGTNWPFTLGITILTTMLIFWTLSRPRARAFFGEINER